MKLHTKRRVTTVTLITVILSCLVLTSFFRDFAIIKVQAIGTPDAYGNVIMNLTIHQWNGSAWVERLFWDNDTNWETSVEDDRPINITLWIRLNNTLASSTAEAISYTRIYCNITDGGSIWNNEEFNNTATGSDANYYYCQEQGHWNATGYPSAGVDYTVVTRYEAYY